MSRFRTVFCGLVGAVLLAGCTAGVSDPGFNDPYEAQNRRAHAFNTNVDGGVVSRAGKVYTGVVPQEFRIGFSNMADTLSLPRTVVNQLLQGRPRVGLCDAAILRPRRLPRPRHDLGLPEHRA